VTGYSLDVRSASLSRRRHAETAPRTSPAGHGAALATTGPTGTIIGVNRHPRPLTAVAAGLLLFGGVACGTDDEPEAAETAIDLDSDDGMYTEPGDDPMHDDPMYDDPMYDDPMYDDGMYDEPVDDRRTWEFHLATIDGWEYDVTYTAGTHTFTKRVEDSPPGQARLVVEDPTTSSFSATGTIEGRNAPQLSYATSSNRVIYAVPTDVVETDRGFSESRSRFPCRTFGPRDFDIPTGTTAYYCGIQRDASTIPMPGMLPPGEPWESGDLDENAVDAFLNATTDSEPLYWETNIPLGGKFCMLHFLPDGTVNVAQHPDNCTIAQ
jgi:hypothetical protein